MKSIVAVALERADDAVDAVARIAENPLDAPRLEPVDEEIRGFHGCTRYADEDNAVAMLRELFASAPRAR